MINELNRNPKATQIDFLVTPVNNDVVLSLHVAVPTLPVFIGRGAGEGGRVHFISVICFACLHYHEQFFCDTCVFVEPIELKN